MMKKIAIGILSLMTLSQTLVGQDRQLGWTYQSNTLGVGITDIEVWNTYYSWRTSFYHALEQRIEFETGVSKNLQTALYLNIDNVLEAPEGDTDELVRKSSFSFSSEWKYQLSDPMLNKLGSALYGEVTVGPQEFELEGKIILDKRINKHLFAFNAVGEYELEYEAEHGEVEREWEVPVEFDLAYMYNFSNRFGVGLEMRNHNEIVEEGWEHSALFAGPTVFFSKNNFFMILNAQPQITELMGNSRELDEHEMLSARLLFALTL